MPQILHSVLAEARSLAAGAENFTYDLPTNPLSVVLCTIRALNNTTTLSNYHAIAAFFSKLSNINIKHRGATIIDGDSRDIAVAMGLMSKWYPGLGQVNDTDNDVRSMTFPLLFGRFPYDPKECFPATRRGDLVLSMATAADPTGLDGFSLQLETVELLDAEPERFVKLTTKAQIMSATGDNDVELPIGNKLLGMLMRPLVFPTGANFTSSFGQVATKVDNVEVGYSATNWETLQGMFARRFNGSWLWRQHTHTENLAAAYTQNASSNQAKADFDLQQQYALLDFDPNRDGMYALDTKGAARVTLVATSDQADASPSYVLPFELVEIGGQAAAA